MVLTEWTDDGPRYAEVKHILVWERKVYMIMKHWTATHFNRHRHAYVVEQSGDLLEYKQLRL